MQGRVAAGSFPAFSFRASDSGFKGLGFGFRI